MKAGAQLTLSIKKLIYYYCVCLICTYMGTCMCQALMWKPEDNFVESVVSFIFTWAAELKPKLAVFWVKSQASLSSLYSVWDSTAWDDAAYIQEATALLC